MIKRDSENRGGLGHWAAESNEDRFLEHLPSDSAALTRSCRKRALVSVAHSSGRLQRPSPGGCEEPAGCCSTRGAGSSALKDSHTGGEIRRSKGWHASSMTRPATHVQPSCPMSIPPVPSPSHLPHLHPSCPMSDCAHHLFQWEGTRVVPNNHCVTCGHGKEVARAM